MPDTRRGRAAAPRAEAWRRRVLVWLAAVVLLLTCFPFAATTAATAPAGSVDLAAVRDHLPLVGQLAMLEDRGGSQTAVEALHRTGWHAATSRQLTRGFTSSAFWLQGAFRNDSGQAVTRWLAVGTPRLEDVRFFRMTPDLQAVTQTLLAGNRVAIADRPVKSALSVFPVTLAPGETMRFAVRVQSRSAVNLKVDLCTPDFCDETEDRDALIEAWLLGSATTIALFLLIASATCRDIVLLLLAALILADVACEAALQGLLYRYVLTGGGEAALRAPGVLASVTLALCSAMVLTFGNLGRVVYWRWFYRVNIVVLLLIGCMALFGDYRASAVLLLGATIACNVMWPVSLLDGWRQGFGHARLLLWCYVPDGIRLLLREAVFFGLLGERSIDHLKLFLGNPSLLILAGLVSILRLRELDRARRQAQTDLLDVQAREQERLQRTVEDRTRELQTALLAAEEAGRAKTDFLARISHDLRTPLTSIMGFASLVQGGGRDHADYGTAILRSGTHMLGMVNDLIDYAAGADPDRLHVEPVYLAALVDSIAREAGKLAGERGNRFELRFTGELAPVLELDSKRIRQVLGNLIDNANKFTDWGVVTLSVDCRPAASPCLPVRLTFTVEDTGCGIAPADQARIFEPFQRLDTAHRQPGVGLGLAIVRQWVAQMDGTLALDSVPGKGSTFRVVLAARPCEEAETVREQMADAIGLLPRIDGRGRRIWIVDDTEEILRFLADELSGLGFTVDTAPDGLSLLERIERVVRGEGSGPDLVLTDVAMPGVDGAAVLDAVRRHLPGTPVVAISALPQDIGGLPGRAAGAGYDAYLLKPLHRALLRGTLARLLHLPHRAAVTVPVTPQEGSADEEAAEAEAALTYPPPHALAEAQQLIGYGAVSDLADWALDLIERDAGCAAFARQVHRLAKLGDLCALQALLRTGYSP